MANYSQIAFGSTGGDVKQLQKLLNQEGYSLAEDGIYGKNTQAAVKDYQSKNNLTVDGITGSKTWASLTTPKTQPVAEKTETVQTPKVPEAVYQESETAKALAQQIDIYRQNAPESYNFSQSEKIQSLLSQILDREDFSYDVNGDALYQQYKDQYTTQGKLAMLDTMGQAAAMTGGYGNSYAQTAGQQTYQGYLQQLGQVIPELYQLAYDSYESKGQALAQQYQALSQQEQEEYDRYQDQVSSYNQGLDALLQSYAAQVKADRAAFESDRDYAYQQYRDQVEDKARQEEIAEDKRRYELELALSQAAKSTSSKSSSSGSKKTGTLTITEYNAIHKQAQGYAEQGQPYLEKYLEGLVSSGSISEELAGTIMRTYFPEYKEPEIIYDV